MTLLMGLLGVILFLAIVSFWYVLIPYALMLLANSLFNEDFALWQIIIIWWLIMFITGRIRGGNRDGN